MRNTKGDVDFASDVAKARTYLASVPLGKKLIEDFDKTKATIVPNAEPNGGYSGRKNVITWNPRGVEYHVGKNGNGGRESSALVLAHEMHHARQMKEFRDHKTGPFAIENGLLDVMKNGAASDFDKTEAEVKMMAYFLGIETRPTEEDAAAFEASLAKELGEPIRASYEDGGNRAGYVADVTSHD